MINVGLVGFGLSGRYLQAPFFQTNPNFKLLKIATSREIPTVLFPETQRVDNFEDLIADKNIELISICSPSNTHFDLAKKCLLADKHVLLEKPMTATAEEAKELVSLAKSKNKVLYVFQNRRYDSDFQTVKKVIESGILGEILKFEAHFDRYKPILNPKKWKEVPSPANGILYDLGAHLIDQSIHLFGKPLDYSGEVFTQRENSEIDDAFDLRLNYGRLKVALKSSLMVKELGPRYIIHGTKGSFIKYGIDVQEDHLVAGLWPGSVGFGVEPKELEGILNVNLNGLEIKGKVDTLPGNWNLLFNDLYEAIKNNKKPSLDLEDIIVQLEIINSIKE